MTIICMIMHKLRYFAQANTSIFVYKYNSCV
nr:MAG TPA: hypothetical protein [Caudoviricetes sp.]